MTQEEALKAALWMQTVSVNETSIDARNEGIPCVLALEVDTLSVTFPDPPEPLEGEEPPPPVDEGLRTWRVGTVETAVTTCNALAVEARAFPIGFALALSPEQLVTIAYDVPMQHDTTTPALATED